MEWEPSFIVLHVDIVFLEPVVKEGVFQCMFCDFCQKLGDCHCVGLFLSHLLNIPSLYMPVFVPVPHYFCYYHFIIWFNIRYFIVVSLLRIILVFRVLCTSIWIPGTYKAVQKWNTKNIIKLINRMKVNKHNYPRNTF